MFKIAIFRLSSIVFISFVLLLLLNACDSSGGTTTNFKSGQLVISSLTESNIIIGESTTATVRLSGSQGVITPITVAITNNNPLVMSESPTVCNLTTRNDSCEIVLTGESAGETTFIASANLYESVTSAVLKVRARFIYFTNTNESSYTQCLVGESVIMPNTCSTISPAGAGILNAPFGIAIDDGLVYIINYSGNSYTQCTVGESGIESGTCNTVTLGSLNGPTGIAINKGFAYIMNSLTNNYIQCNIGDLGIESSSCTVVTVDSGSNEPFAIAIKNDFAFITNSNTNSYTRCTLGESGIESNTCVTNVLPGLDGPAGIAFNAGYVYITNFAAFPPASYVQCVVGESEIESSTCITVTPSGLAELNGPVGIAFNNNFIYIANSFSFYPSNYTQCMVNGGLVESSTCVNVTPSLSSGYLNGPGFIAIGS